MVRHEDEGWQYKRVGVNAILPLAAVSDVEACAKILGENKNETLTRAIFLLMRLVRAQELGEGIFIGNRETGELIELEFMNPDLTELFASRLSPDEPGLD